MTDLPDPLFIAAGLALLGLVPFIAVMATSFVKISIVLSLVRNAMGIQQIPPNIALHGIALVLTIYIFFVGGGFLVYLGLLYHSYVLWPVFSFFPSFPPESTVYFLQLFDKIMAFAVLLAAPAVIAMFLARGNLRVGEKTSSN